MTNQQRQESIDHKYQCGSEIRGLAKWCQQCKHKMPKGGCRMRKDKATQDCLCAKAYNKSWRKR